jgi:hypothetical protein
MIFCIWCGQEHDSFLLHRCPNGDDFTIRSLRALKGEQAPYPNLKTVFKRRKSDDDTLVDPKNGKPYSELTLTQEDVDMLISLKIKW